ncbi:hypothetical protein ACPV3A_04505 [Paenibacillus sp. Dod16]|uniref:hypothetical protein n=1 Tax=Paenibacillus sp. Dod16 TaxID=3416392 RepID=UPI003CE878D8
MSYDLRSSVVHGGTISADESSKHAPNHASCAQGAVRTMYKIVANGGGQEVRYSPNKALMFRIICYLTERVSDRSCKNEPIAQITDLRSDTAIAVLQLVPACGLEATVKLAVHCSPPTPPIPHQPGLGSWLADVGWGPRRGLVPTPAGGGWDPRRGLVPTPAGVGWGPRSGLVPN